MRDPRGRKRPRPQSNEELRRQFQRNTIVPPSDLETIVNRILRKNVPTNFLSSLIFSPTQFQSIVLQIFKKIQFNGFTFFELVLEGKIDESMATADRDRWQQLEHLTRHIPSLKKDVDNTKTNFVQPNFRNYAFLNDLVKNDVSIRNPVIEKEKRPEDFAIENNSFYIQLIVPSIVFDTM